MFVIFIIGKEWVEYVNEILVMIRKNSFKILGIYKNQTKEGFEEIIQEEIKQEFIVIITLNKGGIIKNVVNEVGLKFNSEHIFHGFGDEAKVNSILDFLKLPKKEFFISNVYADLKISPFISKIAYTLMNVGMNDIYFNILDVGLVKIEDSYQYKYIMGNKDEYIKYWNENMGKRFIEDHSPEAFDELITNFKIADSEFPVVVMKNGKWIVQDGTHRLSILKSKGVDYVTVAVISIYEREIKDLLRKTVISSHPNAWNNNRTEFGYHSFNMFGFSIQGQRNPLQRLEKIKEHYDFRGKVVLDLGCNTGGMLFHVPEIRHGIGIDFDIDCIDACEFIRDRTNYNSKLDFFCYDLNYFNCEKFCNTHFIYPIHPDIIFLLSIGSWIKNWKKLYIDAFQSGNAILLETNNDEEGKIQLNLFNDLFANITLVSSRSDDDITGNIGRKTYLIKKE